MDRRFMELSDEEIVLLARGLGDLISRSPLRSHAHETIAEYGRSIVELAAEVAARASGGKQ